MSEQEGRVLNTLHQVSYDVKGGLSQFTSREILSRRDDEQTKIWSEQLGVQGTGGFTMNVCLHSAHLGCGPSSNVNPQHESTYSVIVVESWFLTQYVN